MGGNERRFRAASLLISCRRWKSQASFGLCIPKGKCKDFAVKWLLVPLFWVYVRQGGPSFVNHQEFHDAIKSLSLVGHESQAGQWSAKSDFCRAQPGEQYIVKQHKVCCEWAPDALISRISIE